MEVPQWGPEQQTQAIQMNIKYNLQSKNIYSVNNQMLYVSRYTVSFVFHIVFNITVL